MLQPLRHRPPRTPRSWFLPGWVRRADQKAGNAVTDLPAPAVVNRALRTISTISDGGAFWVLLTLAVALSGREGRRAAWRGLLALLAATTITNLIAKRLIRQRRPWGRGVRHRRPTTRTPTSPAFPSGHSATAAAFATAVALADRRRGATTVPVAAVAVYSRLHLGFHTLSDVAAGAVLGGAVGAAVHALLQARVRRPDGADGH